MIKTHNISSCNKMKTRITILLITFIACHFSYAAGDINQTRREAEQGNAQAQYDLGEAYFKGLGVTRSNIEAMKWYRKAAEQGHGNAQYRVGQLYGGYGGIITDEIEQAAWFYLSRSNGSTGDAYIYQDKLDVRIRLRSQKRARELAAKIAAGESTEKR